MSNQALTGSRSRQTNSWLTRLARLVTVTYPFCSRSVASWRPENRWRPSRSPALLTSQHDWIMPSHHHRPKVPTVPTHPSIHQMDKPNKPRDEKKDGTSLGKRASTTSDASLPIPGRIGSMVRSRHHVGTTRSGVTTGVAKVERLPQLSQCALPSLHTRPFAASALTCSTPFSAGAL